MTAAFTTSTDRVLARSCAEVPAERLAAIEIVTDEPGLVPRRLGATMQSALFDALMPPGASRFLVVGSLREDVLHDVGAGMRLS